MFINELNDYSEYFQLQENMKTLVDKSDNFNDKIEYVAGVDVAYNEESNTMIGAIVVLDYKSFEVIDSSYHIMEITFPYVPGLFSFREIPSIIHAYHKLSIKPDIIVCDGQGIAHPKGVGMATHLGINLQVPTIGCAKKRLYGEYTEQNIGNTKGDFEYLKSNDNVIGAVLRTKDNVKPMFVSIGHRVSLKSSIAIINYLTPRFRLPETTRKSDQLVNKLLKNFLEKN